MPQPRQMTARKAMRMRQFDYSSQGAYFVTIVTNNRLNLFGRVEDEEMKQNEAGTMVAKEYEALEQLFEGMGCLDYVVMPNHFHCLIYLDKDKGITLPEIIAHFKSVTTHKYILGVKANGWQRFDQKLWQRNYWDDIIFNGLQFEMVQRYILLNPSRWNKDAINENHDSDVDHIVKRIKELR